MEKVVFKCNKIIKYKISKKNINIVIKKNLNNLNNKLN